MLAQADETAPTTTAALDPRQPGPGGTYTRPVTVTLTATDGAGGCGVDTTEYRINGGDFQTYTAPITRSQPGDYPIEFRSTDRTGNVEATKSVTFKIAVPDELPDEPQRRVRRADAGPEVDRPARRRRRGATSSTGGCGSRSATAT